MTAIMEPDTTTTMRQTLLCLRAGHKQVRDALRDVHYMHDLIMSGFRHLLLGQHRPDARAHLGVLYAFRADSDGILRVIVQSPHTPIWNGIRPAALDTVPESWTMPAHRDGDTIRFQLRAQPTVAVSQGPGLRGKKRAVRGRSEQLAWLQRRLVAAGLDVTYADVSHRLDLESETKSLPPRQRPEVDQRFFLRTYAFTGTATIRDLNAYNHARRHGIGPGKAYGCGLLLTR